MEAFSTPKRPKLLKIGLVILVIALILGASAGFYFFIYPKLVSDRETNEEPTRYFEGPEYYEEVNGEKRLLVVEGVIVEIDEEGITITLGGGDYDIPREDIGEILAADLGTEGGEPQIQTLSYEDLFVGLFVSYNPRFGTITLGAGALGNE